MQEVDELSLQVVVERGVPLVDASPEDRFEIDSLVMG